MSWTGEELLTRAEVLEGPLTAAQQALLPELHRAAEAALRLRLRPGAQGHEEALGYAALRLALAQLQGGTPVSFTAGDFSVQRETEDAYRGAMELLAPWLTDGFAFRRV